MPRLVVAGLALALVAFPVRSEVYRNPGPPFSIDDPEGWKILPGEGGLATRAIGPGSAMNVSVAAARRFELIERRRAGLGGEPAAFFSYRPVVDQPSGPVEIHFYKIIPTHTFCKQA